MSFVLSTSIPIGAEDRKLIFSKEVIHDKLKWKLATRILRVWPHRATYIEVYVECLPVVPGTPFDTCAKFTFNNNAKTCFPETFCSTKPQSQTLRFKIENLAEPTRLGYYVSTIVNLWPQTPQNDPVNEVPSLDTARIEALEKDVASLKQALTQAIERKDGRLQTTDSKVALVENPAEKALESNQLQQTSTEAHLQSQIRLLTVALTLSNEKRAGSEKVLQKLELDKKNLSETITVLEGQLAEMKISNSNLSDLLEKRDKSFETVKNKFEEVEKKLQLENNKLTRDVAHLTAISNSIGVSYIEKMGKLRKEFDQMEAELLEQVDKVEKEIKEKDALILHLTHSAGTNRTQMQQQSATPSVEKKAPEVNTPTVLVATTPTSSTTAAQQKQQQQEQQLLTSAMSAVAVGESSSAVDAELLAMFSKKEQVDMYQNFLSAGVGVNEIIVMNSLPEDTKMPFKHRDTNKMLPEGDWPTIKDLSTWIRCHPEFFADFGETSFVRLISNKLAPSTPASSMPSAPPKPALAMTSSNYLPNELIRSKQDYFRVEKVLAQFGWGRWHEMKKSGDLEFSEKDIEYMCRTLLLHFLRQFRGEERIGNAVFDLIPPPNVSASPDNLRCRFLQKQGWAALPEYNPPIFTLDPVLKRHVNQHANKLVQKIYLMQYLVEHMIGGQRVIVECPTTKWNEVEIYEFPTVTEKFVDGWDSDCDKALLVGCWRHGLDNYEAIKTNETLCFVKKNLPSPSECWLRFKRLVNTSSNNWFENKQAAAVTPNVLVTPIPTSLLPAAQKLQQQKLPAAEAGEVSGSSSPTPAKLSAGSIVPSSTTKKNVPSPTASAEPSAQPTPTPKTASPKPEEEKKVARMTVGEYVMKLKAQSVSLKDQCQKEKTEVENYKNIVEELESTTQEKDAEIERLKRDCKEYSQKNQDLLVDINDLKKDYALLEQELEEKDSVIHEKDEEIMDLREVKKQNRAYEKEYVKLTDNNEQLRDRVKKMEQDLKRYECSSENYRKTIVNLQKNYDESIKNNDDLEKTIKELKAKEATHFANFLNSTFNQ